MYLHSAFFLLPFRRCAPRKALATSREPRSARRNRSRRPPRRQTESLHQMIPPRKSTKSTEAKEATNSAGFLRSARSLVASPHLQSAMGDLHPMRRGTGTGHGQVFRKGRNLAASSGRDRPARQQGVDGMSQSMVERPDNGKSQSGKLIHY
jgi:hypothetical protein